MVTLIPYLPLQNVALLFTTYFYSILSLGGDHSANMMTHTSVFCVTAIGAVGESALFYSLKNYNKVYLHILCSISLDWLLQHLWAARTEENG